MNSDRMNPMGLMVVLATVLLIGGAVAGRTPAIDAVVRSLNSKSTVDGLDRNKSFTVLFDAYLELEESPFVIGEWYNAGTIHPDMEDWTEFANWAEGNPGMAEAIREAERKTIFGLPYGENNVDRKYRDADLVVRVGVEDTLRNVDFAYLPAMEVMTAFAVAESYRLLEAGQIEAGLDLTLSMCFIHRQGADRDFSIEKTHAIQHLTLMLSVLRDQVYVYLDDISESYLFDVAQKRLPFLRPGRDAIFLPEADYEVSAGLLNEVFGVNEQADRERFAEAFAGIQSAEKPLTRFGAAKRWKLVADLHDSKQLSQERLTLIYDDWWRRWRVEEYDPILDIPTQFERTNPIRYAAVVYSLQDLQQLFDARNELIIAVNGTSVAVGLAGYRATYGNYPTNIQSAYSQFVRKSMDRDFYDRDLAPFGFRIIDSRFRVDTDNGQFWIPSGEAILYSIGADGKSERGAEHTETGEAGDIVLWPPARTMERRAGLVE